MQVKFERREKCWSAIAYTHSQVANGKASSQEYLFNYENRKWKWSQMNSVGIHEQRQDEACKAIEKAWAKAIAQLILEEQVEVCE